MCQPLTRRQFLRFSALVVATYPLLRMDRVLAQVGLGAAVPMHLELVTVTDTQAVITWYTGDPTDLDEFGRPSPVPAPGRVLMGTSPDPSSWEVVAEHEPTAYHYVELDGLTPGTTYFWRAESAGIPAIPTALSPQRAEIAAPPAFTTLVPPPGREVFRIVWVNDLHIGEHVSGLAYSDDRLPRGGFPPGFPVDPDDPYWRTMSRAAVAESVGRGCRLLLANGDLTGEAAPEHVHEARSTLDAFGRLGGTRSLAPGDEPAYFVTRGNHDRAHSGVQWEGCSAVPDRPDLRDCFLDVFSEGFEPGTSRFSVAVGDQTTRYRFVGLDSNDIGSGAGIMPEEELDYLEAELARGEATIPMFHHPVGDFAMLTAFPPGIFGVQLDQAARFRDLISRHDNVAAVYNGHTHRNYRTEATDTGSVPYFEGAATKEYPGGYTTVRLYEGGFMVNFWKARDPAARAWSELSRGEYLGLYPYYTLGAFGDRNWTHAFDASVTAAPADTPPAPAEETVMVEPAVVPPLPETGPSPLATAAAGAALAAGGALGAARLARSAGSAGSERARRARPDEPGA